MTPYGTTHLVALAVFVVGVLPVVRLGRWEHEGGPPVSRYLAGAIVLVQVPTLLVDVVTDFDVGVSLPLHLCDLAWVTAVVALWTRNRLAAALTYFWGLALTSQAILTPSLAEDFPELRYFAFWALHLLVVWSAIFVVWGLRLTPSWRDYRRSVVVTLAWAVLTYSFNEVAGTNYGYLQRKPASGSALDLLGPWPVYVVAEVVIIAAGWALMTWPWARRRATGPPARPQAAARPAQAPAEPPADPR